MSRMERLRNRDGKPRGAKTFSELEAERVASLKKEVDTRIVKYRVENGAMVSRVFASAGDVPEGEGWTSAAAAKAELNAPKPVEMPVASEPAAGAGGIVTNVYTGDDALAKEIAELKAMCDELGIKYHHKAGVKKLTELIEAKNG